VRSTYEPILDSKTIAGFSRRGLCQVARAREVRGDRSNRSRGYRQFRRARDRYSRVVRRRYPPWWRHQIHWCVLSAEVEPQQSGLRVEEQLRVKEARPCQGPDTREQNSPEGDPSKWPRNRGRSCTRQGSCRSDADYPNLTKTSDSGQPQPAPVGAPKHLTPPFPAVFP